MYVKYANETGYWHMLVLVCGHNFYFKKVWVDYETT